MKNKTLKSFLLLATLFAVNSNASSTVNEFDKAIKAIEKIQNIEFEAKKKQLELEKLKKAPAKVVNKKTAAQIAREMKEKQKVETLKQQLSAYIEMLRKESKSIIAQATITDIKTLQIGKKEYLVDKNTINNAVELVNYLVNKRKIINITIFFAEKALETNDKNTLSKTLNAVKSKFRKITEDTKESKLRNKKSIRSDVVSIKTNHYITNNVFLKIISDDEIVIYNKGK